MNKDFRYIIRNGEKDIKVLTKKASEGYSLSYRNISLDVLGALSPLKTKTSDPNESDPEETITLAEDTGFTSPGRSNRRKN